MYYAFNLDNGKIKLCYRIAEIRTALTIARKIGGFIVRSDSDFHKETKAAIEERQSLLYYKP